MNDNVQYVMYTKIVLLAILSGMREQGWNCMDTSNLTFRNSEDTLFQPSIVAFNLFLCRTCGYRLYQQWINNGSTIYCWHLYYLHLQLLMTFSENSRHHPWERETETNKHRQRNANVITEIDRERARVQAMLIIEFWQNQIRQHSPVHTHTHARSARREHLPPGNTVVK